MTILFKDKHASFKEAMLKDKKLYRFIDLYNFLKNQILPKNGDHVYRVDSRGQRIDNTLFIVDEVVEPGLVIGRQLLQDGKNYGKPRCLNEYLNLKTDENQLVSTLIDQNHNYMKEQQEKHKERRKTIAKINRYNKKISQNSQNWTKEKFVIFFNQLKAGDTIYVSDSLLTLKNKKYTILNMDLKSGVVLLGYNILNIHRVIDIERILENRYNRKHFFSREVPIGLDDFSIV